MSASMTVDTVENGSGGMYKAYTSKNTKKYFLTECITTCNAVCIQYVPKCVKQVIYWSAGLQENIMQLQKFYKVVVCLVSCVTVSVKQCVLILVKQHMNNK